MRAVRLDRRRVARRRAGDAGHRGSTPITRKPLLTRSCTGNQGNLGSATSQTFGQHSSDGGIGLAFLGRRGHGHAERPGARAEDGVRAGAGLRVHGEDGSLGMSRQIEHASTPSKSAEPTRTRVAPSSMADSKSLDMPIDSSESGRPVRCRKASRVWRS